MEKISIPDGAAEIISTLHHQGYKAYIVGGCVRDVILGKEPKDWDICTSALPEQIKSCVNGETYDTGIKHGTITVSMLDGNYEVTTFRVDGDYSDSRRPDSVEFVSDLASDLVRRDFTINALAYSEDEGVIDLVGGIDDLNEKVIRCVGNPDDRFREDALRVMRALRFASVLGFSIEEETAYSIHKNAWRLNNIAAERIRVELCKMLCGDNILNVLLEYNDVITTIIPELKPCVGFDQNNRYHQYTIYDHIAHAVSNYQGDDVSVKVALLLHDVGKPQCYTEDEKGGHFHGHGVVSHVMAKSILEKLRFDNKTKREILDLVLYHDSVIEPTPKTVRRWFNKIGSYRFSQLLEVRIADIMAHAEGTQESRIIRCGKLAIISNDILEQEQCFSLKDLAVNGNDIIQLGINPGKEIGKILNDLLNEVIAGKVNNNRNELLGRVRLFHMNICN